jgi:hypothetical protein
MKIFLSENNVDYTTYTFSYALYALKEDQEDMTEMYEKGFLPYTGNPDMEKEVYYFARSLRVNLDKFDDTSENRRVNRMVEPLDISMTLHSKADFDTDGPEFLGFCENYINERIGEDHMNMERWKYILSRETGTHLFEFRTADKAVGYVLAALNGEMVHYWFAFFDTEYMRTHSLGKWMMWKVIRWAKDKGRKYAYLGTAYKPAALYKLRDHKGLEFWDGTAWNADVKTLKEWCQTDLEPKNADRFKNIENPDDYLSTL